MSKDLQGFYVDANRLGDWLSRLEDLAEQVRELALEVREADCVEINVRKVDASDRPAAEPAKRKRAKTQAPAQAVVAEAASDLEKAVAVAKKAPKAAANGHAVAAPAVAEDPSEQRIIKPRIRFGRLRQQLMVDHGQHVTEHMVQMCGSDRTTFRLKKHLERFLGTFDDETTAKMAYGEAVGIEHANEMGVDDVLGEVTDVLTHDDGRVSLWCNEDEVDKVRAQRGQVNADTEVSHAGDDAGDPSQQAV